ncbi:GNAT family N-acetyltransferase [Clostridium sp.]|uniref:GNAT family N-acetyltransferase n=1 Tax=Clostridium sp. TaxID=1506 RepID=UPI00321756A7
MNDVEFISSLFTNEEYELYFAENNTSEDEWKERFEFLCHKKNYIISDSETGNKVGWIMYEIHENECDLDLIVLQYGLIGKAYGYHTIKKMESIVKNQVNCIKLDVQHRNSRAVKFYQRYGFRIVGEEEQPCSDGFQPYYNMKYDILK